MNWIKHFRHGLTNNETTFRTYRTDTGDLQANIERAENALINYNDTCARWAALTEATGAALLNIRKDIKAVVKRLKESEDWTDNYTLLLGVDDLPVAGNFTNFKPVVWLKDQVGDVGVNFLKDGVDGMNVYSRLQGELDFSFLGFAKRSPYKDPRPLKSYICKMREYRLTAMVGGEEIGQPGDVVSIQLDGR